MTQTIWEDSRPFTSASSSTIVLLLSVLFIKDSTLKTQKTGLKISKLKYLVPPSPVLWIKSRSVLPLNYIPQPFLEVLFYPSIHHPSIHPLLGINPRASCCAWPHAELHPPPTLYFSLRQDLGKLLRQAPTSDPPALASEVGEITDVQHCTWLWPIFNFLYLNPAVLGQQLPLMGPTGKQQLWLEKKLVYGAPFSDP